MTAVLCSGRIANRAPYHLPRAVHSFGSRANLGLAAWRCHASAVVDRCYSTWYTSGLQCGFAHATEGGSTHRWKSSAGERSSLWPRYATLLRPMLLAKEGNPRRGCLSTQVPVWLLMTALTRARDRVSPLDGVNGKESGGFGCVGNSLLQFCPFPTDRGRIGWPLWLWCATLRYWSAVLLTRLSVLVLLLGTPTVWATHAWRRRMFSASSMKLV